MKTRLLVLALFLCATFAAKAQYVTIPDANFVAWLQTNYPVAMQGNQMDTNFVQGEWELIINDDNISNLEGIQYFKQVSQFVCEDCSSLVYIPAFPPLLASIVITEAKIQSLPDLPEYLDSLVIDGCGELTAIPALPQWLTVLQCNFDTSLTSLPSLPPYLRILTVVDGNLTSLPPLPDSLIILGVPNNKLSSIPTLPSNLYRAYLSNNLLTQFPTLPATLNWLDVRNNHLHSLPALSHCLHLTMLDCAYNLLDSIPTLPENMHWLYCDHNQLTALPQLTYNNGFSSLSSLSCSHNQISTYPYQQQLVYLDISYNNISYFLIPLSGSYLDISNNPIACLPAIGQIQDFLFENTNIICVPNYGNVSNSSPTLSNFPLCVIINENGCNASEAIRGKVFIDNNLDCTPDANDIYLAELGFVIAHSSNSYQHVYSNNFGEFNASSQGAGVYSVTIDSAILPFEIVCGGGVSLYDTAGIIDTILDDFNFALRCKTGFDLAAHSISTAGIFRPANNTMVDIHAGDLANFYNANCAHGVAGTVTVTINGPATYISPASGATTPSNVSGNVLTWNVADFGTADALHDFNIVVQTDTFAQIGQQVCFTVRVTPTMGDNDSANNTLAHCFNIVNSYDPNDKTAYPAGDIDTAQEWLTYTVRFQNTGNAEAQHIYIMDTLENDLDVSTFQLLAYSHQSNVQINENIVRFNFPNINLPNSTSDEPGSHGYVQYKVKLKENLPIGTTIENTAFIYFDFNQPVVTNTATNTIAEIQDTTIIGIKPIARAFDINIYPNPANNQVTVTAGQTGNVIYMYTAQGKLVATQNMGGTAETLNIAELPGGIYYIEVAGKAGTARKKLVKF